MAETELEAKPKNHWIHIPTQLVVVSFCAYWWYWHKPVPSKAVLWLAGVAVIMALWEMRPIHKAGYLLLVIWLMFIENRAIDKDRADFAAEEARSRQEERQQFSDIGIAITTNVQKLLDHSDQQFQATMRTTNQILISAATNVAISRQTVDRMTGGDSFIVVVPAFVPTSGTTTFPLMIFSVGENPLWDVTVSLAEKPEAAATITDFADFLAGRGKPRPIYSGYSFSSGAIFPILGQTITPDQAQNVTTYYINTQARNGSTKETLKVRFNKELSVWQCSCTVARLIGEKEKPIKSL